MICIEMGPPPSFCYSLPAFFLIFEKTEVVFFSGHSLARLGREAGTGSTVAVPSRSRSPRARPHDTRRARQPSRRQPATGHVRRPDPITASNTDGGCGAGAAHVVGGEQQTYGTLPCLALLRFDAARQSFSIVCAGIAAEPESSIIQSTHACLFAHAHPVPVASRDRVQQRCDATRHDGGGTAAPAHRNLIYARAWFS